MELPSFKANKELYIKVRVMEAIEEIQLSLYMLRAGFLRNSTSKTFMAFKAFLSALLSANMNSILKTKSKDEGEWYKKRGYSVPTRSIKGISQDLDRLGFKNVSYVEDRAINLHSYQYNGLNPDFSPYRNKEEVIRDIISVDEFILSSLREWLSNFFDDEIKTSYDKTAGELKKIKEKLKLFL